MFEPLMVQPAQVLNPAAPSMKHNTHTTFTHMHIQAESKTIVHASPMVAIIDPQQYGMHPAPAMPASSALSCQIRLSCCMAGLVTRCRLHFHVNQLSLLAVLSAASGKDLSAYKLACCLGWSKAVIAGPFLTPAQQ